MNTHHDKQKALQAFWDAEAEFVKMIVNILKAICANLTNTMDIVNRYAGLTGMLSSALSIGSILPGIIIGPIGVMFQLLLMFNNDKINLASKLVNFFTMTGSSGTSIASVILHSVVFPLSMISSSLALINQGWVLGELVYRRFYKNDTVTPLEWFDAIQGVALAGLSMAASVLLITPAAPLGYIMFALIGAYKLADSLGYNPIKMIFNLYDETNDINQTTSTEQIQNTLTPANEVKADNKVEQCQTPVATVENKNNKTSTTMRIKSHFSPGFYALPENPKEKVASIATASKVTPQT